MNTKAQPASLEKIALVKITAMMFNIPFIKEKLSDLHVYSSVASVYMQMRMIDPRPVNHENKILKAIMENIANVLDKVNVVVHLRTKIIEIAEPMVTQIMKWIAYHKKRIWFSHTVTLLCLKSLCWTSQGLINIRTTTELLLKDQTLDISIRFKLACIYCFETDIFILWGQIPESFRVLFHRTLSGQPELVKLWVFCLSDKLNVELKSTDNFNEFGFRKAIQSDNEIAALYFWQKLPPRQKEEILTNSSNIISLIRNEQYRAPISANYTRIIYFFMSRMNENQQIKFLQEDIRMNRRSTVLHGFLDPPHLDIFIQTANKMWRFIPSNDYTNLLFKITDKIVNGEKDCRNILMEFWRQGSNSCKKDFLQRHNNTFLNIYLHNQTSIEPADAEIIVFVLKNASPEEKDNFNFASTGKDLCCKLIKDHRWKLVEFLANNCLSTETRRVFIKEIILSIKDGNWFTHFISCNKWADLERFINWCLLFKDASDKESKEFKCLQEYRKEIITKYFEWCLIPIEEIDKEKSSYKEFTFKNKFEVIESFVGWCFLSLQEFKEFKREMIYHLTKVYKYEIVKEITLRDKLEIFYNFVTSCLSSKEIEMYKKDLLFL